MDGLTISKSKPFAGSCYLAFDYAGPAFASQWVCSLRFTGALPRDDRCMRFSGWPQNALPCRGDGFVAIRVIRDSATRDQTA